MKIHDLKTWPEFFEALLNGSKTFELRKDDRFFCEGDGVLLREWIPETKQYSGRMLLRRITYLIRRSSVGGLEEGFVILAVAPVVP